MEQKPSQKDDPVWSILPSYDMYQNTFNGGMDPPQYGEAESVHDSIHSSLRISSDVPTEVTVVTSYENLPNVDPASDSSSVSTPSLIVADESTNTWRETLLDNIHNLRNFSSSDNPLTQNVELSVHFTEDVGKHGVVPKHIDPSQFEYKQGDYLNGYILIRNKCSVPLPFDMFYVLFEGNLTITEDGDTPKKSRVKVKKYLEMYDFAASWNQSRVDRLLSEKTETQYCNICVNDPIDGSCLGIVGRVLKPGVLYKRFFTFKIPDRLLDTECNAHNLPSHTWLPPTLGLSEKERLLIDQRFRNSNDFSFVGTSTSYGVLARFIGKASHFNVNDEFNLATKLIDVKGDEFIIFRECISFVRVIQESNILSNSEKLINTETARILYDNLIGRIKEKIDEGNEIKSTLAAGGKLQDLRSLDFVSSSSDPANEALKARQLYTRLDDISKGTSLRVVKPTQYEISVPLIKKKLLGAVKYQGMLQVSSPKTEYILNYMSPKRFKSGISENKHLWKLEIPVNVCFQPSGDLHGAKIPHITRITPELVVFSAKAGKHPIPIELTHDHLFRNKSSKLVNLKSMDNFENIVKTPMRKYASELYSIIKEIGSQNLKVEKSLLEDVCALAAVDVKTNNLTLRESRVVESGGNSISVETPVSIEMDEKNGSFSKEFSIVVDATKAQKKGTKLQKLPADYSSVDEFCLVPSFQNCKLVRMYYLKVLIGFSTGEFIELKLPVTIAKIPGN
ncbi:hypothetical protein JCM33374_g5511 [Metschnikowia sp. JCM 33374]|nr:hypothetical protein JCM33374_g5511 [Metschnikowia sp. JCM 33374]